jgi:hypothetical protein
VSAAQAGPRGASMRKATAAEVLVSIGSQSIGLSQRRGQRDAQPSADQPRTQARRPERPSRRRGTTPDGARLTRGPSALSLGAASEATRPADVTVAALEGDVHDLWCACHRLQHGCNS